MSSLEIKVLCAGVFLILLMVGGTVIHVHILPMAYDKYQNIHTVYIKSLMIMAMYPYSLTSTKATITWKNTKATIKWQKNKFCFSKLNITIF